MAFERGERGLGESGFISICNSPPIYFAFLHHRCQCKVLWAIKMRTQCAIDELFEARIQIGNQCHKCIYLCGFIIVAGVLLARSSARECY